ncbi:lysozyme inhibitor LprI family protein [Hyphobacterium sp. HN65]|uniref:Lysozyme inhibitor LprI family protein n=1 Tax=Hyphobacterium lacteum TaxID=3116575 RepID=A0ABU7LRB2_9PROT|nr:lysozyme inhibitor LprI family protein [Hyphobacterium sp. HN65]MEE2526451.1 lysozyme inhibitor LprI family protein [Hyphobacterium sp. HN65]
MIASVLLGLFALQGAEIRPMIECSEHMNDDRALLSCLSGLLEAAEDDLDTALAAARQEASEIDLDMPGVADAASRLGAAHSAWIAYRDAECERRASLLLIGDDAEAVATDCRIALTRARATELETQ